MGTPETAKVERANNTPSPIPAKTFEYKDGKVMHSPEDLEMETTALLKKAVSQGILTETVAKMHEEEVDKLDEGEDKENRLMEIYDAVSKDFGIAEKFNKAGSKNNKYLQFKDKYFQIKNEFQELLRELDVKYGVKTPTEGGYIEAIKIMKGKKDEVGIKALSEDINKMSRLINLNQALIDVDKILNRFTEENISDDMILEEESEAIAALEHIAQKGAEEFDKEEAVLNIEMAAKKGAKAHDNEVRKWPEQNN